MKVTIYGCGQVGLKTAEALIKQKHEVTIIDRDADSFRKIEESELCHFVVGDAIDQEVLHKAETDQADVFMALTGEDNANIFAAQASKELFKVKKVIVRIADPVRAQAFSEMGLVTVCSTDLISDAVRKKMAAK